MWTKENVHNTGPSVFTNLGLERKTAIETVELQKGGGSFRPSSILITLEDWREKSLSHKSTVRVSVILNKSTIYNWKEKFTPKLLICCIHGLKLLDTIQQNYNIDTGWNIIFLLHKAIIRGPLKFLHPLFCLKSPIYAATPLLCWAVTLVPCQLLQVQT